MRRLAVTTTVTPSQRSTAVRFSNKKSPLILSRFSGLTLDRDCYPPKRDGADSNKFVGHLQDCKPTNLSDLSKSNYRLRNMPQNFIGRTMQCLGKAHRECA